MTGRSWPRDGAGGTLDATGSKPGPYYLLAEGDAPLVGIGTTTNPEPLERAVSFGVVAIQRALKRLTNHHDLHITGVFDYPTSVAAVRFQKDASLTKDGIVGPVTARALFRPAIARLATAQVPACLLTGQIQNESGFDPGAVGYVDDRDLGLMQINGRWHPELTEADRFAPIVAVKYAIGLYEAALDQLDGNLRDAVASYNLGIGGARTWIQHGRPDVIDYYTSGPVKVREYIDRILSGCPPQ